MARPQSGEDWIELYNPMGLPVPLEGLALSEQATPGTRRFPGLSFVGAHGHLQLWASDLAEPDATHLNFKLSADGETIRLFAPGRSLPVDQVEYGPQSTGWSQGRVPDGGAVMASFAPGEATPGATNRGSSPAIVVSEILSHSDPPYEDAIELHNLGAVDVDIGNWFLSDNPGQPRKYRIPAGTVLSAGGFRAFYAGQFGVGVNGFLLDSAEGEQVVLSAATSAGTLTGWQTLVRFGPLRNRVSAGLPFGALATDFVPLERLTFGRDNPVNLSDFRSGSGASNAPPRIGPVVMSEIRFDASESNELPDSAAFVELLNTSVQRVALFDPLYPTNTWRIRGSASFDFPFNVGLNGGEYLVLVPFDPQLEPLRLQEFIESSRLPPTIQVFGPILGALSPGGVEIELLRPDEPEGPDDPRAGLVPHEPVKRLVAYAAAPWPLPSPYSGFSLHRCEPAGYASDPMHWCAALPTPGGRFVADTDEDGLPDLWEAAYALDPGDALDAALDGDQDGAVNAQEYHAGTDPRGGSSALRFVRVWSSGIGGIELEFEIVPARVYAIQQAQGLPGAGWEQVWQGGPLAEGGIHSVTLPGPHATPAYYRLEVVLTP